MLFESNRIFILGLRTKMGSVTSDMSPGTLSVNITPFPHYKIFAIIGSFVALLIYHFKLYSDVIALNPRIQVSLNILNGYNWVLKHSIKGDAQSVTLAVQSLRNTMIVAVFVGGSSLQFAFYYVNAYSANDAIESRSRHIILSSILFLSFFCWATVIRLASHLSLMIGTLDKNQYNNSPFYHDIYPENDIESAATESSPLVTYKGVSRTVNEANRMMKTMLLCFR